MNGRLGRHRMQERNIVDAVPEMWKQITHVLTTVAALTKIPAGLDDAALTLMSTAAKSFHFDRLAVHADHCRLVVKRVNVAWAAVHEKKDDALRLRREQWSFGCQRIGKLRRRLYPSCEEAIAGQERSQRSRTKAAAGFPKEFPPRATTEVTSSVGRHLISFNPNR